MQDDMGSRFSLIFIKAVTETDRLTGGKSSLNRDAESFRHIYITYSFTGKVLSDSEGELVLMRVRLVRQGQSNKVLMISRNGAGRGLGDQAHRHPGDLGSPSHPGKCGG